MRLFGYARVSTNRQSLDMQMKFLEKSGVSPHRILTDKASENSTDWEGLRLLLIKVEKGDVVLIKSLDRLGQDITDMIKLIKEFGKLGVTVRFLDEDISTEGIMGRLAITILSAAAQAERKRIMERSQEVRLKEKAKGLEVGKKRIVPVNKVHEMRANGIGVTAIARSLGICKNSVYNALKKKI